MFCGDEGSLQELQNHPSYGRRDNICWENTYAREKTAGPFSLIFFNAKNQTQNYTLRKKMNWVFVFGAKI